MPYSPTLDISVRFALPPELVWAALTDQHLSRHWWPSLELELLQGGEFRIQTPRPRKKRPRTGTGRLTELVGGESFTVALESAPRGYDSALDLSVTQAKQKTKLRILESGLPRNEYAELIAAECRDGWREVLGALDEFLDDKSNIRRVERRLGA